MRHGLKSLIIPAVIAALATGLLTDSAAVAEGVRRGLSACAGVLIPALFPFMTLCCYLIRSDAVRVLALPLRPLATRLLRLPEELGPVVLLSFVGGYPVGARMIAGLLRQGRIDRDAARRMLCFCVNCSPSFLISAVGAGMLLNARTGALIFASQALASLMIGTVCSLRAPIPSGGRREREKRPRNAFVPAVSEAASSMLGMCAYTVLFSGAFGLLESGGLAKGASELLRLDLNAVKAVAAGLFEVTGGCLASAGLGGEAAVLGISLCCSWGGLSVIFQVLSCFEEDGPDFGPFFLSRLAHGCLGAGIALALYRRTGVEAAAWMSSGPPALEADGRSMLISLCLLCMCSILIMEAKWAGKKPTGNKWKKQRIDF